MQRLVQLFKALSDEARLRILNLILEAGELCVCDLQRILGFTQTKVSRHLAYLKHSGILHDERRGTYVVYRLADTDDPSMQILLREIRSLFAEEETLRRDIETMREAVQQGCCVSLRTVPATGSEGHA